MTRQNRFEVRWTGVALIDLESIIEYIAVENPLNANQIRLSIIKQADTLSHFPNRGRVFPELKEAGEMSFHELFMDPYRIMYHIERKGVFIVGVFDGRRNLEEIVLQRIQII